MLRAEASDDIIDEHETLIESIAPANTVEIEPARELTPHETVSTNQPLRRYSSARKGSLLEGRREDAKPANRHGRSPGLGRLRKESPTPGATLHNKRPPAERRGASSLLRHPSNSEINAKNADLSPAEETEQEQLLTNREDPLHDGILTHFIQAQSLTVDFERLEKIELQFSAGLTGYPDECSARKNRQPASNEDYGIYTEIKPSIGTHSQRKMEQRLTASMKDGEGIENWLDSSGALENQPCPLKDVKERGFRRFDPDSAYLGKTITAAKTEEETDPGNYELCIEVSRLEFASHHFMAKEDLLAAQLISTFREYKRRETVGMVALYENKLEALEGALLDSREALFSDKKMEDPMGCFQQTLQFEREVKNSNREDRVAEIRQLYEEEAKLMEDTIESMQKVSDEIHEERNRQGFSLTNVSFVATQQSTESEKARAHSRKKLDERILMAEEEGISGLAASGPFDGFDSVNGGSFRSRRIETMCQAHAAARVEIMNRLALLESRPSADPNDPDVNFLNHQLRELGEIPRRVQKSNEERRAAKKRAKECVRTGDVGVHRGKAMATALVKESATSSTELQKGPALTKRNRATRQHYAVQLIINGHNVGISESSHLKQDFSLEFGELFRVNMTRWPQQVCLRLLEKGTIKDSTIAEIFLTVPGFAGTPPRDPKPVPYQWTCHRPFLPLWQQEKQSIEPQEGGIASVVYPSGTLIVQCGWLPRNASTFGFNQGGGLGSTCSTWNPLAAESAAPIDVEEGWTGMPPPPKMSVDGVLRKSVGQAVALRHNQLKVGHLLQTVGLDPNDPRNEPLLELLKARKAAQCGLTNERVFRLDPPAEVKFQLKTRAPIKRAKFLRGRWAACGAIKEGWVPKPDVASTITPLSVRDTMNEKAYSQGLHMLEGLLKSTEDQDGQQEDQWQKRQSTSLTLARGALAGAIEEREDRIREFVLAVRNAVSRCQIDHAPRLDTDDIVREAPLPEFKLNLASILALMQPSRKLRPRRKQVKVLHSFPTKCELLITIQRAANLPQRDAAFSSAVGAGGTLRATATDDNENDDPLNASYEILSPFVEVKFQGNSGRTMTMAGTDPLFNEQIVLPFNPTDGDFSPVALQRGSDVVTINVFDEISVKRKRPPTIRSPQRRHADSPDPGNGLYPKREKRFLGYLSLPISTVYQLGRVEGTFELEAPPVHLGYQRERYGRSPILGVFVTLKPELQKPSAKGEERRSGEQEELSRHATRWHSQVAAIDHCSRRHICCIAIDTDGTSSLLPRYVAATPLPPSLHRLQDASSVESLMRKAARFVSLVPFLDDTAYSLHRQDVWTTSAEFLYMAAGDHEEHANLLAGYFLELGQQTYVVLGASTMGARSAFVLTTGQVLKEREEGGGKEPERSESDTENASPKTPSNRMASSPQLRLWNPLTGRSCLVKDITCEFREVGVVFNGENLWANIQSSTEPWTINWDFSSSSNWLPFFGPNLSSRSLATLQAPVFYNELDARVYEELEVQVEEIIRDALCRARRLMVSQTHKRLSRVLKRLLKQVPEAVEEIMESTLKEQDNHSKNVLRGQLISKLEERHMQTIAKEAKGHRIGSHILKIPFCDKLDTVLKDLLLNTCMHGTDDESVKFAMAAHVEKTGVAYVCCIWVYVATICEA
ncbi:hypothetical protein BSKO_02036 [Bryopsis sp. KO-2023]|nr:hypothetical protein BSKO_02036 [Bryopsis sp. KO-2023]